MTASKIFVGTSPNTSVYLEPAMANRHGLIAGATGTGKTATLQLIAEGLASRGVPVFAPDIKGDLSGIALPSTPNPKIDERAKKVGITSYTPMGNPVVFWDLRGKYGHPLRTTVSEMGPLLFTRLLDLNDTQEGVLSIAFKIADDHGLLLLDYDDLFSLLNWISESRSELRDTYGSLAETTLATLRRKLLEFHERGGQELFGEPALNLQHLMNRLPDGRGVINIMDARDVVTDPRAYTSFLLWLLSELFEDLPEIGDQSLPRLVFFFDEAHLLFRDAPRDLVEKIETVVRLIRSKGVGVFFITQNPLDIPETVLGQLGNRFQHALRAFTPRDQKAVRVAAETFRQNPSFNTEEAITQLGVGEALVSCLDPTGIPAPVERTFIAPPVSQLGPVSEDERRSIIGLSPLRGVYDQRVDRESAQEMLEKRKATTFNVTVPDAPRPIPAPAPKAEKPVKEKPSALEKTVQSAASSFLRSLGTQLGREIFRGVLGSVIKRR